jgi:gas vesicle protein
MRKALNFLYGFLMGGLIGAALAILLAPYSGEELRKEMQSRFASFQEEIGAAVSERKVELEKRLTELRQPKQPA